MSDILLIENVLKFSGLDKTMFCFQIVLLIQNTFFDCGSAEYVSINVSKLGHLKAWHFEKSEYLLCH